jgi:hypothetical protein
VNCFKFLLIRWLLLIGQLPALSTLFFSIPLSYFNLSHCNIRWSTVCMFCLHGHSGLSMNFKRCRQDRIFPCPLIIVVKFGFKCKFTSNLLSTLGKNSLVIAPFVVSSHWFCHFLILSSRVSFFIALFGILLCVTQWFWVASFASRSQFCHVTHSSVCCEL